MSAPTITLAETLHEDIDGVLLDAKLISRVEGSSAPARIENYENYPSEAPDLFVVSDAGEPVSAGRLLEAIADRQASIDEAHGEWWAENMRGDS